MDYASPPAEPVYLDLGGHVRRYQRYWLGLRLISVVPLLLLASTVFAQSISSWGGTFPPMMLAFIILDPSNAITLIPLVYLFIAISCVGAYSVLRTATILIASIVCLAILGDQFNFGFLASSDELEIDLDVHFPTIFSLVALIVLATSVVAILRRNAVPAIGHTMFLTMGNIFPAFLSRLALLPRTLVHLRIGMLLAIAMLIVAGISSAYVSLYLLLLALLQLVLLAKALFRIFEHLDRKIFLVAFEQLYVDAIISIMALLFVAIAIGCARLIKIIVRSGQVDMEIAGERITVLLRSFFDDSAKVTPIAWLGRARFARLRLEEAIAPSLDQIGSLIAIGAPGEKLPKLGARRYYFDDTSWQEAIISYCRRANIITMIAGTTPWVQWELRAIQQNNLLSRLVVVVPPGTEEDRRRRIESFVSGMVDKTLARHLQDACQRNILVCAFPRGESLLVIESSKQNQADYELALHTAIHKIAGGDHFSVNATISTCSAKIIRLKNWCLVCVSLSLAAIVVAAGPIVEMRHRGEVAGSRFNERRWLQLGGMQPKTMASLAPYFGLGFSEQTIYVPRNWGFNSIVLVVKDNSIAVRDLCIEYADSDRRCFNVWGAIGASEILGPLSLERKSIKSIKLRARSRIFNKRDIRPAYVELLVN